MICDWCFLSAPVSYEIFSSFWHNLMYFWRTFWCLKTAKRCFRPHFDSLSDAQIWNKLVDIIYDFARQKNLLVYFITLWSFCTKIELKFFFKLWKTFETGFWHTSFSENFGTFSKFSLILSISFLKIFLIYFISLLCHQFYLKSVSLLVHIVAWNCRSYSTLKKLVHMLTSHVYSIMK